MEHMLSAAPKSRAEADDIMEQYFDALDDSIFEPLISAMTDAEDEDVFAIMRASDNELTLFEKAMYLLRRRGIITLADSMQLIDRKKAIRNARAA